MWRLFIIIGFIIMVIGGATSCSTDSEKFNGNPTQVGRQFLENHGIDAGYKRSVDLDTQKGTINVGKEEYKIAYFKNVPQWISFGVNQKDGSSAIIKSIDGVAVKQDPETWWEEQGKYLFQHPDHIIGDASIYVENGPTLVKASSGFVSVTAKIKNISGRDINLCKIEYDVVDPNGVQLKHEMSLVSGLKAGQSAAINDHVGFDFPTAGHSIDHLANVSARVSFDK